MKYYVHIDKVTSRPVRCTHEAGFHATQIAVEVEAALGEQLMTGNISAMADYDIIHDGSGYLIEKKQSSAVADRGNLMTTMVELQYTVGSDYTIAIDFGKGTITTTSNNNRRSNLLVVDSDVEERGDHCFYITKKGDPAVLYNFFACPIKMMERHIGSVIESPLPTTIPVDISVFTELSSKTFSLEIING